MANLLRDMEVVEVRDGMVICRHSQPTSPISGTNAGSALAASVGAYMARTPVLLAELTPAGAQPTIGDHVQDMDDGTRQHVPKGPPGP